MSETRKPLINNIEESVTVVVALILAKDKKAQLLAALNRVKKDYVDPAKSSWFTWRNRVDAFLFMLSAFEEAEIPDHILLLDNVARFFADETGGWKTTSANTVLLRELLEQTVGHTLGEKLTNEVIASFRKQFAPYAAEQIEEEKRLLREKAAVRTIRVTKKEAEAMEGSVPRARLSIKASAVVTRRESLPQPKKLNMTLFANLESIVGGQASTIALRAAKPVQPVSVSKTNMAPEPIDEQPFDRARCMAAMKNAFGGV